MGRSNESKKPTRRRASTSGVADWETVPGDLLCRVVATVTRGGGAVRFGYTRDGGAYALGIYDDGTHNTEYRGASEDVCGWLGDIIADYE